MSEAVDWRAAERRARALVRPGPRATDAERRALVADLREAARIAPGLVAEVTGLHAAAATAAQGPVYVLDRPGWARATIVSAADLLGDALDPTTPAKARWQGEQFGVLLAVVAGKILGQYDPLGGRLLLVAPNVLHLERELDADAKDLRLWVCLHEQTHAVQAAAAPWLADELRGRARRITHALESDTAAGLGERVERLRTLVLGTGAEAGDASDRDAATATSGGALLDSLLSTEERREVGDLLALISLLEGHAEVVMDSVGPARIPSVIRIRRQVEARRSGGGVIDQIFRRLLGLDGKIAQYRAGTRFVRQVVAAVGHDGLNLVWRRPEHLPTAQELADPAAWVARVVHRRGPDGAADGGPDGAADGGPGGAAGYGVDDATP